MATQLPQQFDWLKIHLGFYDRLELSHTASKQKLWEELLGDALDRYVVQSVGFMKTPIPQKYLPKDRQNV